MSKIVHRNRIGIYDLSTNINRSGFGGGRFIKPHTGASNKAIIIIIVIIIIIITIIMSLQNTRNDSSPLAYTNTYKDHTYKLYCWMWPTDLSEEATTER